MNKEIPLSSVRLRSYNSATGTVGQTFSGSEGKTLTDLGTATLGLRFILLPLQGLILFAGQGRHLQSAKSPS